MDKKLTDPTVHPDPYKTQGSNNAPGELNKPDLDKDGKPQSTAIGNAAQAWSIAKSLEQASRARIDLQAILMSKYGGEPPFNQKKLKEALQEWRNNFPTNFMASIVDRIVPQLLDTLNRGKYVTASALPEEYPSAADKSTVFQTKTTKLFRAWSGWRDFCNLLVTENTILGYTTPAWIDPKQTGEWRPTFVRQDEAFVPEGTGQHPSKTPLFVIKKSFLMYEFVDLVRNQKAAEAAGYSVDNFITVTDNPDPNRKETARTYSDMMREYNMDASYRQGAKTINVFIVFVKEYNGGIDLWMIEEKNGTELRYVKDFAQDMEEITAFFTIQTGNGKLYGSKGIARMLVNLHVAIDRSRNLALDSSFIGQLVLCKAPAGKLNSVEFRISHPFIFLDDGITDVIPQAFRFDLNSFVAMDSKLRELAEDVAGAFIPHQVEDGASPNTKIEAGAKVGRENSVKEGIESRFLSQFADMISLMQKKAFSEINIKEAKRLFEKRQKEQEKENAGPITKGILLLTEKAFGFIKGLMGDKLHNLQARGEAATGDTEAIGALIAMMEDGLDVQDIYLLAHTPSSGSAVDSTAEKDAATVGFIGQNAMNPFINKKVATQMAAEIVVGQDRAQKLIIPGDDPNDDKLAIRQQNMEFASMLEGEMMPVVSQDNHEVHRKTLGPKIEQITQLIQVSPNKAMIATAESSLQHFADHIAAEIATGVPQKQLAGDMQQVHKWDSAIQSIKKKVADAEAAGQDVESLGLGGSQGSPLSANGANGAIPGEDTAIKLKDLQIKQQAEDRKGAEFQHQKTIETHKLALDTTKRGLEVQQHIEQASTPVEPTVPPPAK